MENKLYSIKELPEVFGATKWFWRSQIWDRKLPVVKVGRKQFIAAEDIEKFIRDNRQFA
jgi:hypothetical protein